MELHERLTTARQAPPPGRDDPFAEIKNRVHMDLRGPSMAEEKPSPPQRSKDPGFYDRAQREADDRMFDRMEARRAAKKA